jgi:hypothetical protein
MDGNASLPLVRIPTGVARTFMVALLAAAFLLGGTCGYLVRGWRVGPRSHRQPGGEGQIPKSEHSLSTTARMTRARNYRPSGSFSRLSSSALTATSRLDPDIARAAISGRSTRPNLGSKTPAAMGIAIAL